MKWVNAVRHKLSLSVTDLLNARITSSLNNTKNRGEENRRGEQQSLLGTTTATAAASY